MGKMIKKKQIAALVLAGTMAMGSSMQAFACMGVYVGKEVSENGSSYIGRSEDIGAGHTKIFTVHPAEDHEPGAIFEDAYGFSMPYPEHTYQYTLAKDSPLFGEGEEPYAEVGINENEVAMTATVSTYYNDKAKAADPLVDTGICELSMGSILLGQAKTARDGVELLGEIVEKYGSGECNTIMISDPNEAWYMEIVSGHQYAAIKLPEDQVAAIPNMMLLGTVDVTDTENVIASEGLVSLAEENGFLKTEDRMIHVTQTYGAENPGKGQLTRLWQGTYYLNHEKGEGLSIEPSEDGVYGPYDLLFTPDKKFSTQDIMKFLAYRGEGTKMDFNVNESIYAIGNKNQAELIEQQKQVDVDMQKLYEKSPELAQEKATEIGKVIAQDAFNSAKSILTELKAFKESGSTEMFVPSVLTEHIMPNYTVARVMDEVSTEALEALIAKAEAVQKDMYTEASYATLEQELENAKTVLADEFAVQDEIDAATKQLDSALQGLEKIQAAVPQPEKESVSEGKTTPTQPSPKTVDATPLMWLLVAAAGSALVSVNVWKRREEK